MNEKNPELEVEVVAALYGDDEYKKPITCSDPTIIPDGGGLGYTVDLSAFNISGLVHIRIREKESP